MEFFLLVPIASAIWIGALGIRDLRRGAYVWGAVSLIMAVGLLLVPFPSQTVTIDLPSQNP